MTTTSKRKQKTSSNSATIIDAPVAAPASIDAPAAARKSAKPSKQADVVALLQKPEGASVDEMVAATGWLPHTTRAMLTGLKKKGYALHSDKIDDVCRYRIVSGPTA